MTEVFDGEEWSGGLPMLSAYDNNATLAPTPEKCFNSSLEEWNTTARYMVSNGTAVNCTALFQVRIALLN
ncbi:MAG: hypothetical protein AAFO91_16740 [Bacteroidota bacterium]